MPRSTTARPKSKIYLLDLHTPGYLGRKPMIGLVLFLLGMALFAVMVVNLEMNGPLISVDNHVAHSLNNLSLHSPFLVRWIMHFAFYAGVYGPEAIGIVFGFYFLFKRFWPELSMIAIAWIGEALIWRGTSLAFDRPRPHFNHMLWKQMSYPSFPSGHCITSVMCFGLLAYWFVPRTDSTWGKIAIIAAAVLMNVYVGFGRMFVGAHFLTDVLAGYALGIAWSALVYTSVEWISQRKKSPRKTVFAAKTSGD